MRNKKGFTLVELIIVVGLLGLFGISIGLTLTKIFKTSKDNELKSFISRIESSANTYLTSNSELLEELYTNKGYILITIGDLIEEGLLDDNAINPETNEFVDPLEVIKISLDSAGAISIEYPAKEIDEDYLQAMDIVIEIHSSTTDLCYQGINGNGLRYISALSGDVKELEKNVNIKCDDQKVNINKLGIYSLEYDYKLVDSETEKWKQQSRKVIVVDTVAPAINSFTSSSDNTTDATLTGKAIDQGSGIKYYYFGEEDNLTDISTRGFKLDTTLSEITKTSTVTKSGIYYFYVQDEAGNINKEVTTVTISNYSPTEPELKCDYIANSYLTPTGNSTTKVIDGEIYYEYQITTSFERLARRRDASFASPTIGYGHRKDSKVYFHKIPGEYNDSFQWYKSEYGDFSVGQICKGDVTKTLKSSGYVDRDRCYTNTSGNWEAKELELSSHSGADVLAIDLDDGWFYVDNVDNTEVSCFIMSQSFSR